MRPSQAMPRLHNDPITPTLFFIIFGLATLAHITADMYVPALPAIAEALKTKASLIQLTLSSYLLGAGASQLIYGPISDRVGRRLPLLFGIGLSIAGGIICFLAPSVIALIIARFIQGIGLGACNSVGRSVARDLFSGNHLARIGSYLSMANATFLAFAPTMGGYILHFYGWQFIFIFLVAYAILIWLFLYFKLPETNSNLNIHATRPTVFIKNYFTLLRSPSFLGYTLCASIAYAGILAYLTSGPFILQTIIGLTPVQFGWLAFAVAGAFFISSLINSSLVMKIGYHTMLFYGILLMLLGGILMLIPGLIGYLNTSLVMIPVFIYCLGAGFSISNASAGSFQHFPHMSGSAAALFGCMQILMAALASSLSAAIHEVNQIPLATIFISFAAFSLCSWKFLATRQQTSTSI